MKNPTPSKQPSDDSLARLLKLAGPRPEPSAEIRDEIYDQVLSAWQKKTWRSVVMRRIVPAAIAATVVATFAVLLWQQQFQPAPRIAGNVAHLDRGHLAYSADDSWHALKTGDMLVGDTSIRTGATERAGLMLTNGISLRLDHDTRLKLESAGRIALVQGRLYVDTAGQRLPAGIEIVTTAGVVRDIGTQFEVSIGGSQIQMQVRVRDGEVVLDTNAEDYHAVRGEALIRYSDGQIARTAITSRDASWDWAYDVAPFFDTDGRRVSELIDWVVRETGREADYADAMTRNAAASTRIVGSVSASTPEETLDLALATTRFKYYINEQVLAIEKHR